MRRPPALFAILLALGCSSSSSSVNVAGASDAGGAGEVEVPDAGAADAPDDSWDTFPSTPLATVKSDGGKLSIAAFTAPKQPPASGTISVKLVVTGATSSDPVDGLVIDVEPIMPSMGHGTPVVPITTPKGAGRYLVEKVNLFMRGTWELNVTISGAVKDTAVVTVQAR